MTCGVQEDRNSDPRNAGRRADERRAHFANSLSLLCPGSLLVAHDLVGKPTSTADQVRIMCFGVGKLARNRAPDYRRSRIRSFPRKRESRWSNRLRDTMLGPRLRRNERIFTAPHTQPHHCERSEAIQLSEQAALDCFADARNDDAKNRGPKLDSRLRGNERSLSRRLPFAGTSGRCSRITALSK
jgi:hypothetical protein